MHVQQSMGHAHRTYSVVTCRNEDLAALAASALPALVAGACAVAWSKPAGRGPLPALWRSLLSFSALWKGEALPAPAAIDGVGLARPAAIPAPLADPLTGVLSMLFAADGGAEGGF